MPTAAVVGVLARGARVAKSGETFYRTMSKADHATLMSTRKLPATSEAFISPTKSFAQGYDGVLAEITLKPGTTKALQSIGVRDASALTRAAHSEMPMVSKGWKSNNAFFKGEGNQINIGLGNGKALDIFNSGIQTVK